MSGAELGKTFTAALRSVGTACTMASAGVYMHRRSFVTPEGKRMFALLSQQVTIPLFLFSKIVFCNQDWSNEPCPNVTKSLSDVWMLLFWPAYVVSCGFAVGMVVARVSRTPVKQRCAVLAACAFGNSTGLPITLLTVVHANYPSTTKLGKIDPTLFLSVYLLLYPVLQWGIGGWLLSPDEEEILEELGGTTFDDGDTRTTKSSVRQNVPHILNVDLIRRKSSIGTGCGTSQRYLTENGGDGNVHHPHFGGSMPHVDSNVSDYSEIPTSFIGPAITMTPGTPTKSTRVLPGTPTMSNIQAQYQSTNTTSNVQDQCQNSNDDSYGHHTFFEDEEEEYLADEAAAAASAAEAAAARADEEDDENCSTITFGYSPERNGDNGCKTKSKGDGGVHRISTATTSNLTTSAAAVESTPFLRCETRMHDDDEGDVVAGAVIVVKWYETVWNVLTKCGQPPVIGAVLGIIVAATPLRGIFVDLIDRNDSAPLEWLFDGLYSIGQAAVPINMIILGINLSSSASKKSVVDDRMAADEDSLSNRTLAAIVIGKMIVMPIVGVVSTVVFGTYLWDLPTDIDAAVYLVTMIVFITPTANNVMIMVELAGGPRMKESIARAIGWQYAVAPFLLSFSVAAVVFVASRWIRPGTYEVGK